METYSLFELNQYIRQVIALNFDEQIWVRCELSDANESRGHWYLNLVEKGREGDVIAQSQAVIWRGTFSLLNRKLGSDLSSMLQPGMELSLAVRINFHERYGLKFVVEDLDASYTLGKLAIQRQAVIESLRAKKLLEKNRGLDLRPVIQRIAVISSETAAGWADFRRTLETNEYGYKYRIELFPAAMQGERVEAEVTDRLEEIAEKPGAYDAVAILRGGGSKLDLSGFDSEKIGVRIANHPLPVFTGIGHETDETVCDLVAWRSLKTPTALANFFIEHNARFESQIQDLGLRIRENSQRYLQREDVQLDRTLQMVSVYSQQRFTLETDQLDRLWDQLLVYARHKVSGEWQQLNAFESLYRSVDPRQTLRRGYTLTFKDKKPIRSIRDINDGDIIETMMIDGHIESRIEKLTKKDSDEENDL